MPVIEKPWTDHSQGTLRTTGNALDVALDGQGFLAVNGPTGPLYTRNGNLRLAADGRLTTSDGYALRSRAGVPMVLDAARNIDIAADGTVTQDGAVIGQLEVADFTSTAGLTKQGSNYFRVTDPKLSATAPAAATVSQGQLESSNTGPAEAAVRLVGVMRQFEMLQKAVTIGAEMNKHAIEEVAKV
jgi:flagellar basal body rod protein FlgG